MNIHEYQAKAVLREFGVPVPRGIAAFSVEEAEKAAKDLGGPVWVVKAQIHAGGRGKAGGVKVVKLDRRRQARSGAAARLDLGDAPDRAARQGGAPALYRGRLGHRPRILSVGAGRSRHLAGRLRGLDRGRHGDRRGRAHAPGKNLEFFRRSGDRLHAALRAPRRARLGLEPRCRQTGRKRAAETLFGISRQGHEHAGDQSARRHQIGRA